MKLAQKIIENFSKQLKNHIKHPFKSYTGVTWSKSQVDKYNDEVDKANAYIKDGKKVPENILNGLHNLFQTFSQK
jgi:hypothetical protein